MKILQVCNTSFYMEKFLLPLVAALHEDGFDVHTAYVGQVPDTTPVTHHDIEVIDSLNPVKMVKCIWALAKLMRQERFDVVNSHNRNTSFAARIAAFLVGVPCNIYTAHGYYFHDDQRPLGYKLTLWLEALLARITTATLSQSAEDIGVIQPYAKHHEIHWIGNGIDANQFKPCSDRDTVRGQLNLEQGVFTVVAVGRLVNGKGFIDLIRAIRQLTERGRDVRLVIVGGNIAGDFQSSARQLHDALNDDLIKDRIRITGIVDNVNEYLACADVFVSPSYREGISRAMLEAMSCAIPVVVTAIRGAREVIEDRHNGFLFPPRDHDRLTDILDALYADDTLRASTAAEARATVLSTYTESAYLSRQVRAIRDVADKHLPLATTAQE